MRTVVAWIILNGAFSVFMAMMAMWNMGSTICSSDVTWNSQDLNLRSRDQANIMEASRFMNLDKTTLLSRELRKLAICIPFVEKEVPVLVNWIKYTWNRKYCSPACKSASSSYIAHRDLILYPAHPLNKTGSEELLLSSVAAFNSCFHEIHIISANLSDVEDGYPNGVSNQWYKLVLGQIPEIAIKR
jgi:hypothetical protein